MKNVPEIRFKGFEEEWNQYLIKNVASRHDNLRIPIKESKRKKGNVPYYGANGIQDYVSGYTHNGEYVLVAEDGANDLNIYPVQYVNGKVWVNNHAHVLQAKCEYGTNKFLRFAISNLKIKPYLVGCGRLKLNSEVLMTLGIKLPKLDSQIIISKYLYSQDDNIINTSKKIASLKQLKSACLISMFPQQGETVPRVRFKGFDGEWKNIKLKDILVERHEMSTITFLLPQLSFTISEGVIKPENRKTNKRDFLIKDKKNKKYIVTKIGDIIYNPANVVFGAIHRNNLCDGVVSPIYKIFYSEEDTKFVECIVRNPAFINKLTLYTEGTVTKLKTLKPESFLDMEVCITNDKAEQHQIASYFRNLDIQISEQEKRLEKLKQIKAACLDKMFV